MRRGAERPIFPRIAKSDHAVFVTPDRLKEFLCRFKLRLLQGPRRFEGTPFRKSGAAPGNGLISISGPCRRCAISAYLFVGWGVGMTAATYPRPVSHQPVPGLLKIQRARSVEGWKFSLMLEARDDQTEPSLPATRFQGGTLNITLPIMDYFCCSMHVMVSLFCLWLTAL